MLSHLEDLLPPEPGPLLAERVLAEGRLRLRRRRRRIVGVAVAGIALAATGFVGVRAAQDESPEHITVAGRDPAADGTEPATTSEGAPSTTTTTASEHPIGQIVSEGSVPDGAFVAATVDGEILVVDSASGEVLRTIAMLPDDRPVNGIAVAPDRSTVYATRSRYQGDGELVRLAPGEPVQVLGAGDPVGVSPDGQFVAVGGRGATSNPLIRVIEPATEITTEVVLPMPGDASVRDVEWLDGEHLLVEAGLPETGSDLFVVALDTGAARRIGPPQGAIDGTSWALGGAGPNGVTIAEWCCSLDANSYAGGAFLLLVDPTTGAELRRDEMPDGIWGISVGPDGRVLGSGRAGFDATTTGIVALGTWDQLGTDNYVAVDW